MCLESIWSKHKRHLNHKQLVWHSVLPLFGLLFVIQYSLILNLMFSQTGLVELGRESLLVIGSVCPLLSQNNMAWSKASPW